MKLLVLLAAAMPLAAQCSFVFQPSQVTSVPAAGGSGSISVNTSPYACGWSYGSDSSWITVGTGTAADNIGNGNGSFTYTVSANLSPAPRQGNILVSGYPFTYTVPVTQLASTCSMTLPATSASAPVGGVTSSFQVQTGCYWNAYSNNSWIAVPANAGTTTGTGTTATTVPNGTSGTGNGSVSFAATANRCVASRTGSMTVQLGSLTQTSATLTYPTQIFTLTQDGSNDNLTISQTSAAVTSAAGTGNFTVTTGDGCSWSAFKSVSWITITSQTSGTGTSVLRYSYTANTSSARTGTIQVGTRTFTITQQGVQLPTPQINAVLNAASYAVGATAVAPGEIVALFGTLLGPTSGVGMQLNTDGKSVSTTLGGTTVLFDGVAAPLTYASAQQVNAVVPFGVSGSTQIQVQYQGVTSAAFPMAVQAAAPGIFTLDGDGIGNGAILNQDSSLNTKSKPAPAGSIIQIFCTGGGTTTPASANGVLTSAANALTQPVKVTIGGLNAEVKYAGGAPGAVAGALQINAVVPNGIAAGGSVPVVVQIGNWQSQSGVTVAVQ